MSAISSLGVTKQEQNQSLCVQLRPKLSPHVPSFTKHSSSPSPHTGPPSLFFMHTSFNSFSCHREPVNTLLSCHCSVAELCLTLCEPMNCSTPGFPVLHCLPGFALTAVQPSHPLSPPPPALSLSQHQGLCQ